MCTVTSVNYAKTLWLSKMSCNDVVNKVIIQLGIDKAISAYIYTYELDTSRLAGLSIKEFTVADREWVLFVLGNRANSDKMHNYDVVIGPTANDDTRTALRVYSIGEYGELGSDDALDILIRRLKAFNLPDQVYFGNNKAASLLILKGDVIAL